MRRTFPVDLDLLKTQIDDLGDLLNEQGIPEDAPLWGLVEMSYGIYSHLRGQGYGSVSVENVHSNRENEELGAQNVHE